MSYLVRYIHCIAISNQRILAMDEATVSVRYKDYGDGDRQKVMHLSRRLSRLVRKWRTGPARCAEPADCGSWENCRPDAPVVGDGDTVAWKEGKGQQAPGGLTGR